MSINDPAPRFISNNELRAKDIFGRPRKVLYSIEDGIQYHGNSWKDKVLLRAGRHKVSAEEKADYQSKVLKLNARMLRGTYMKTTLGFMVGIGAGFCLILLFDSLNHRLHLFGDGGISPVAYLLGGFVGVLLVPTFQRIHDVGRSAWWLLVPVYNIYLLTQPSDVANKWGEVPRDWSKSS